MNSEQTDEESPSTREIRQLIPATNFVAVFFDEENGAPWVDVIVAWALVADSARGPFPTVMGMVADGKEIVFVDEFPNFLGYLSPEGSLDEWRERAREAFESQQTEGGAQPAAQRRRGL
jgi:hypothetical protein